MKYLNLAGAIILAICGGYMSVIGLTTIFVGVVVPFIILELIKFLMMIHLHAHWKSMGIMLRSFVASCCVVLMIMTSAGVYGYLANSSMGHTTTAVIQNSKIDLINAKIAGLEDRKKALQSDYNRLETIVNGIAALSDPNAAARASATFNRQKAARAEINTQMNLVSQELAGAMQERQLATQDQAKVMNEIGPGVFLAKAFYGNSSTESIEAAVRIVILLITITFDPLAVAVMIIASAQFMKKQEVRVVDTPVAEAPKVEAPVAQVTKPKRKYVRKNKIQTLDLPTIDLSMVADEKKDEHLATVDAKPKATVRIKRKVAEPV
jgi:hypothetical protein